MRVSACIITTELWVIVDRVARLLLFNLFLERVSSCAKIICFGELPALRLIFFFLDFYLFIFKSSNLPAEFLSVSFQEVCPPLLFLIIFVWLMSFRKPLVEIWRPLVENILRYNSRAVVMQPEILRFMSRLWSLFFTRDVADNITCKKERLLDLIVNPEGDFCFIFKLLTANFSRSAFQWEIQAESVRISWEAHSCG